MLRISPEEFPNRAFQLAYFLHRERKTAAEIASRALNKLQLAATAQGKRLYYRLTGRPDTRKARSKVSMGEPHLLQRLVYVESEEYERRKESAARHSHSANDVTPARHSDLVVYFIKHMVRITARRNSFYVTLGLSRLLYNYSTSETMELYNLIIQDPDRVHDDYYYRSRKGVLLKELKERFGELVEISKGSRGEQRWRTSENGQRHHELVAECLRWFTPWATPCVVPERFDPLNDPIKPLNFEGRQPDEEHEVEVNRIHAALHPECFVRLTAANRFAPPDERLELPHFFLANNGDEGQDDSRTPPSLSSDELRVINDLLVQEAMRRKNASTGFLRVLVDGVQRAEINVDHKALAQFQVGEDAELIEVYSSDQHGDLLLATHFLNLNGPRTQDLAISAEGGQRISFTINLLHDEDGSPTGAQVAVAFKETAPAGVTWLAMKGIWTSVFGDKQQSLAWWKPVAGFVVLALLFAGAWWLVTNQQEKTEVVRVVPAPAPTLPVVPDQAPIQAPTSTPEKPPHNQPQVAPSPLLATRKPAPRERDETYVERSLMPNTGANTETDEIATRGIWNRDLMGKPLKEIGKVYIQTLSGNAATSELQTELRARLAEGTVSSSPADQADAALKISVRKANARDDDSRVIVNVRAVSANGYVVWPDARRSLSWRYIGNSRFVADRIVSDLTKAIVTEKGQK